MKTIFNFLSVLVLIAIIIVSCKKKESKTEEPTSTNGYLTVTNISSTEVSGTFSVNLSGGPGIAPSMTGDQFKAKLN